MMNIKRVGVIGAGLMGSGIAQVAAASDYSVTLVEVSDDLVARGLKSIDQSLSRLVDKATIKTADRDATLARLRGTTSLEDLSDVDIAIEAIVENLEAKHDLFTGLHSICKADAIFATNTSSLSVTEIMRAVPIERQRRFVGLHFFNPVPIMKLVEVVRTIITDDQVFDAAAQFGESLGKTAVRTSDRSGFIVNRLLVPYMLDAIRAYENGVGTIVDIDNAMKLGCGHPMGPFTLLDFVGLDTTYFIANIMFDEFREPRFAPPPLLKRMVLAGLLGRKSGSGFYDYSDARNPKPQSLSNR
jgi:3-hydroxybutyryl-CoA dehydrogenase